MANPVTADAFGLLRPRLFGIAYRMLGIPADAEDVLQDAWLRWQQADHERIQCSEAWLVSVVTCLSIDRLRRSMAQGELPLPVRSTHVLSRVHDAFASAAKGPGKVLLVPGP